MPRTRNSLLYVLAAISGFMAMILIMHLMKPRNTPGAGTMVIGAVRDIEIGSTLKKEDVDLLLSPNNINPKLLFTDIQPVIGKVSRKNILKGEVIRSVDLLAEGESLDLLPLLEMSHDTGAFLGLVAQEVQRGAIPYPR